MTPLPHYLRHHKDHDETAFGSDRFGQIAEKIARFFGTPQYIVGQSIIVLVWIVFNGFELFVHFDKYPFILLNLAFSTQAAYAAPLILLAQTRQAYRDKQNEEAAAQHRQEEFDRLTSLLEKDTELTRAVHTLQERLMEIANPTKEEEQAVKIILGLPEELQKLKPKVRSKARTTTKKKETKS